MNEKRCSNLQLMRMGSVSMVFLLGLQATHPADLLRAGRYEEALKVVRDELKAKPRDARLLSIEGIALGQMGQDTEALKAYRAALAVSPDYLPALEGAAQIEYKTNDAVAARAHLARLIQINAHDETAHAMRGVLAARAGECLDAARDFADAPKAVAKQAEAQRLYGGCLFRLRRWGEAERAFRAVLANDAGDRRAAYGLAASQIEAGDFTAALETLKPFGDDAQALALSANALEASGKTPEAIAALRNAIVADPKRESFYTQFAELCFTYKSYQAGIDVIDAGLTQLPNSAKLYLARGVLRAQQGNYDAADADFSKADALDPKEASSADAAVLSLVEANRLPEATRLLDEKLKQHPRDAQLFYFKADVLNRQGDGKGSLLAAQRAVALRPDYALAHDLLARLYAQSGEDERAIRECQAALKSNPNDEAALYRWLRILKAAHREGDASAIAELTKRWNQAREKQKDQEVKESRFRIATSQ